MAYDLIESPRSEVQYVHGYSAREADRLADQANMMSELLDHDTPYPPWNLECGCGTGAQISLREAPRRGLFSEDISADSFVQARARIEAAGHRNVEFRTANLFDLPFGEEQ